VTFWIVLILLSLGAVLFAVWPLYRRKGRMTPLLAVITVFTVAVGAGIYNHVGSPGVSSGHGTVDGLPPMDEVLTSLRARLAENPEDIAGWKMLGRTQMTMQEFAGAVTSYEHAMQLENGQNAQTLVDLAIALLSRDRSMAIEGRAAALIESALALDPNNPAALFYSGVAASDRGDVEMAIARWEVLLGLNPPPEIRAMLEQRIAEWRGEDFVAEAAPGPAPAAVEEAPPADVPADAVVAARVSLSDEAINAIGADANVFIIARDPAQPSPPIAVSRLRLSELPKMVALGDAQSMVQGRALSGFDEFELVARVSLSGGPAAASGDWYGSLIVRPAENNSVFLTIDQQVP